MNRDDHDQQSGPYREDQAVSWTRWDDRVVYAGSEWDVRAVLAQLPAEPHPVARVSLVLALAELAREHALPDVADRLNSLWQDPTRPGEVRFAAAIAWCCLTDTPVPDELRAVVDSYVAQDSGHALADVPWIARIDCWNSLAAITDRMLPSHDHDEHSGPQ